MINQPVDTCDIYSLIQYLCEYNQTASELLDNDGEDLSNLMKQFNEDGALRNPHFRLAYYTKHLIGPHFYAGDFDITDYIIPYINASEDDDFINEIKPYIARLDYALQDTAPDPDNMFQKYLKRLEKLYNWKEDDLVKFRKHVKDTAKFKSVCGFTLKFNISNLDKIQKERLNKVQSSKDAFEVIKTFLASKEINDYAPLRKTFDTRKPEVLGDFVEINKNEDYVAAYFFDIYLNYSKNDLSKYFSGNDIKNGKQFFLYLALFIEAPLYINVERFMNVNGYSLKSFCDTINNSCEVTDRQIRLMLNNALDKEVLLKFLRKYAYTGQRKGKDKNLTEKTTGL